MGGDGRGTGGGEKKEQGAGIMGGDTAKARRDRSVARVRGPGREEICKDRSYFKAS